MRVPVCAHACAQGYKGRQAASVETERNKRLCWEPGSSAVSNKDQMPEGDARKGCSSPGDRLPSRSTSRGPWMAAAVRVHVGGLC